jgi:sugar lactone lactonase YvrE
MEERRGHFDAHAAAFAAVVGEAPRLELVARTDAHEGPFYVSDEDALYFTTVPRASTVARRGPQVAIKRLRLDGHRFLVSGDREAVVKADANVANGMALDRGGALVVCEQGTPSQHARLSRFDPTNGEVATVVDGWTGQCLNSPNDVASRATGPSGSPTPATASCRGSGRRPSPATTSTAPSW